MSFRLTDSDLHIIENVNNSIPIFNVQKVTLDKVKINNGIKLNHILNSTLTPDYENGLYDIYNNIHYYLLYVQAIIIVSLSIYILGKSRFKNIIFPTISVFILSWLSNTIYIKYYNNNNSNNNNNNNNNNGINFYVCDNPNNLFYPITFNNTCETIYINQSSSSSSSIGIPAPKQSFKIFNNNFEIQYEDDKTQGLVYIRSIYGIRTDTNKCFIDNLWKNDANYGYHLPKFDLSIEKNRNEYNGYNNIEKIKLFISRIIGNDYTLLITCPKREMDLQEITFTILYLIFELYKYYNLSNYKIILYFTLISSSRLMPSYITLLTMVLIIQYLDNSGNNNTNYDINNSPSFKKTYSFLKRSAFASISFELLTIIHDFDEFFDKEIYIYYSTVLFSMLSLYFIYYLIISIYNFYKLMPDKWYLKKLFIIIIIMIVKGYLFEFQKDLEKQEQEQQLQQIK